MNKTTKIFDFCRLGISLRNSKKAASVLLMVFEIVGALAVSAILADIALNLGSEETTLKIKTSRDLRLLAHTSIAAPQQLIAYYARDTSEYILSANDILITIYKEETDSPIQRIISKIIPFKGFNLKETTITHKQPIILKKQGFTFEFGTELTTIQTTTLPIVAYTKDPDWIYKKIIIAPKAINGKTNTIGEVITININALTGDRKPAILGDIQEADMLIEIVINPKTVNTIKTYVSSRENYLAKNKKLASLILNKITGNYPKLTIEPIPVISDKHPSLKEADVAVVIEISSNLNGQELITTAPEAIKSYYT